MYNILAFGYEFLSQFIPFFVVLMLFRRSRGKYGASCSIQHYVFPTVFAVYIIAVFHVTGTGTLYDAMRFEAKSLQGRVNLIPFSNEINVLGYLLNVVMFMPLGFLLPLIWKQMGKFVCIFFSGFGFSFLIEASQLLCHRGTDVDDLIMNTLGAVVGFLLYRVWDRLTKSRYQLNDTDPMEWMVFVLTLFLGRFLFFNQLGLINLYYGY